MQMEQQENDEEINDDYRPTTNGSDTTAPSSEQNLDNDDGVNPNNGGTTGITGDGDVSGAPAASATTSVPPNWNQSELIF